MESPNPRIALSLSLVRGFNFVPCSFGVERTLDVFPGVKEKEIIFRRGCVVSDTLGPDLRFATTV